MKKNYSFLKSVILSLVVFCCVISSLTAEELVPEQDYVLSIVYGDKFCSCDTASGEIKFATGAKNSNHAILLQLTDPSKIVAGHNIVVSYEMIEFDNTKDAQVCLQPSSNKGADYNKQAYPIIYNNKETPDVTSGSFSFDCDVLLKSSVKKALVGFRIVDNGNGSYDKYVWQDKFSFKITKVEIQPK